MDLGTISSRYARALFTLAKEKGEESRVYEDMKILKQSILLTPGLMVALGNPIVSTKDKERLLIDAAGVNVSDLYRRFVNLILHHKREQCLPFITYIYIHLYRREKKITRVLFSSAAPVNKATQQHLIDRLTQETGNTIEFTGEVKPELIGGFRLQMGNYRLDASYATRLKDVRERLLENK